MFNLNLNVRVVCRDFCQTLYMFGTYHCCDSSSCYSDTCELAPASAGAKRQTCLSERAVCALRSASNVRRTAARLKHTPNEYWREDTNMRSCDRTFPAETLGCRQGESQEKRVYTLPTFPGVYNTRCNNAIGTQRITKLRKLQSGERARTITTTENTCSSPGYPVTTDLCHFRTL